ncbi:MAG: DUF805 domain-containing protein [Actinobacteria bacterium]|nr:DUF805 domain-containing protein [Actinomycetota bacterium]
MEEGLFVSYLPPPPADSFNPTGSPLAPRPVTFGEAISRFYANYANFKGRASRSEYWFISLYSAVVQIPLYFVALSTGTTDPYTGVAQPNTMFITLMYLFSLINLVPGLAVGVRRLHDTSKSGAMLLIALIPCVGAIVLLVFFATAGDTHENQYGPAS